MPRPYPAGSDLSHPWWDWSILFLTSPAGDSEPVTNHTYIDLQIEYQQLNWLSLYVNIKIWMHSIFFCGSLDLKYWVSNKNLNVNWFFLYNLILITATVYWSFFMSQVVCEGLYICIILFHLNPSCCHNKYFYCFKEEEIEIKEDK